MERLVHQLVQVAGGGWWLDHYVDPGVVTSCTTSSVRGHL